MQWYQEEIERLKRHVVVRSELPKVVFYGSSTITRWLGLEQSFPLIQAVNLGFGGSTLAACAWFLEQVVPLHQPDALVVYAGDNDLGDGRTPEEVVLFYDHLLASVVAILGPLPVCFIAIKLSPARLHLRRSIEYVNACIAERVARQGPPSYYFDLYSSMLDGHGNPQPALFEADGLHLSPMGYALWQRQLTTELARVQLKDSQSPELSVGPALT